MDVDSEADRRRRQARVAELLSCRFPGVDGSRLADDPAVAALVDGLVRFEPGRVPPGADAVDVQGLSVAPPTVDRTLADRAGRAARPWPGGARAAVVITHDVDAFDGLSYFPLRFAGWAATAARAAVGRDWAMAGRTIRRAARWTGWRLTGTDPVADFERWMAIESRHGLRSTFFFLALERALSREGRLYRIEDARVRRVVRTLVHGGWEVGLHASRFDSATAGGLERQRRLLEHVAGQPVRAVRHHYLTAEFPEGWRLMRQAGFDISSNVGFHPPYQGLRTGTCWPHRPIGPDGPWEVPMALMDAAHGPAARLLIPVFERLLAEVVAVGGVLVLNFHTNYVADVDAPGVHAAFEQIADRIRREVDARVLATLTLGEAVDHVAAAAKDA